MEAMAISRSGLDVEWQRLQVIARNIANIETTRTATGEPYAPQRLVSGPATDFARLMEQGGTGRPDGVRVFGVERMTDQVRRVYEPKHPHADEAGFVTYPAIDHGAEMTLMVKTSRAYEANLVALGLARQMYSKALELGRTG